MIQLGNIRSLYEYGRQPVLISALSPVACKECKHGAGTDVKRPARGPEGGGAGGSLPVQTMHFKYMHIKGKANAMAVKQEGKKDSTGQACTTTGLSRKVT